MPVIRVSKIAYEEIQKITEKDNISTSNLIDSLILEKPKNPFIESWLLFLDNLGEKYQNAKLPLLENPK